MDLSISETDEKSKTGLPKATWILYPLLTGFCSADACVAKARERTRNKKLLYILTASVKDTLQILQVVQ